MLVASPPFRVSAAAIKMVTAVAIAGAIWWGCLEFLPPVIGPQPLPDRVLFGLKCVAVAILLAFLTGIEAVAHERLTSAAFDPLAGKESHRLQVNLRYLQNTLEQVIVFVPGVLLLAAYADSAVALSGVVAATTVWTLARFAFWIGYHLGPQQRIAGLVGAAQSMIVLLYVCSRFGHEVAGAWGAAVPVVLFALIEAILVLGVRRK